MRGAETWSAKRVGRRDVAPHRLAASEPVHEQQGRAVLLARRHDVECVRHPHARIVGQPRDIASTHTVMARMSGTS